jgi:hypothetical protein
MELHAAETASPPFASKGILLSGFFSRWNRLSASLHVHANAHGVPALATLLMQGLVC